MARTTEQKAMTKGASYEREAVDRILDSVAALVGDTALCFAAEAVVPEIRRQLQAHIKRTSKKGNEGGLGRN